MIVKTISLEKARLSELGLFFCQRTDLRSAVSCYVIRHTSYVNHPGMELVRGRSL